MTFLNQLCLLVNFDWRVGRCVDMSAGRLGSGLGARLDWARVLERCSPQARKNIMDLRSRHEELRRQILEAQSTAQLRLDFDQYRRRLAGTEHEALLNQLESRAKAFQPTRPDVSAKLRELEQEKQAKVHAGRMHPNPRSSAGLDR